MEITILVGIPNEHRQAAAQLYATAFQKKLATVLGSPDVVASLLCNGMNTARAVAAVSAENELIGVAGFQLHNTSLADVPIASFTLTYGFIRGLFKAMLMAILFYRKPDSKRQLLMDGIVVKEGQRGKGIGTRLFAELENVATLHGMTSIKLDVIDENPEAKKLYEGIGFVARRHTRIPRYIARRIGVSGVTTMIKSL